MPGVRPRPHPGRGMWLEGNEGSFYIEVIFTHVHDGRRHRHDLAVVDPEAHRLAHRLGRSSQVSRSGVTRS